MLSNSLARHFLGRQPRNHPNVLIGHLLRVGHEIYAKLLCLIGIRDSLFAYSEHMLALLGKIPQEAIRIIHL